MTIPPPIVKINALELKTVTVQPYAYEGDARTGLTTRTFRISGLLTAAQWQTLRSTHNDWRTNRIQDPDTFASNDIGTTVPLTINGVNGITVSELACWFSDPPVGEQVGNYVNTSFVLVDAAQALEVLLRQKEKDISKADGERPSLGTVTFGSVTITLTKPLDTRQDGPTVAMTAGGTSFVQGALRSHKVRQVEGYISTGNFAQLLTWYDTAINNVPTVNTWFPVSAPQATAEVIVVQGVKGTRYNVSFTALQIL